MTVLAKLCEGQRWGRARGEATFTSRMTEKEPQDTFTTSHPGASKKITNKNSRGVLAEVTGV